jgi:hypothetical protein
MLSFSTPWWLLAMLALPLVWWLHRFHEPDQAYPVAALFLWRSYKDTGHQRRQAPRAEPIWWLRALTVCLLVLALSGPQWHDRERQTLIVWIDDSASMYALEYGAPRMQQALTELLRQLGTGRFNSITLRSLADPTQMLALGPLATATGRDQMQAWLGTPRGEPKLPLPALMDPGAVHWLVSDGASPGIAEWARLAPISNIISVGTSGENVGISGLSLRRGSTEANDARVLITVTNGGSKNVSRVLELSAGGQRLVTRPLSLAAGAVTHQVITLASIPTAALRASISPADLLPLDDDMELSLAKLQRVGVRLWGDCSAPLKAALAAYPTLDLLTDLKAPAALNVYCGTDQQGQDGPALSVPGHKSFSPVQGEIFWSPASGELAELLLDPAWLSALQPDTPAAGELVLLGTTNRPLILFDAVHKIITVQLNLDSPLLGSRPEFPLLISGLVDLLLENTPGQRDLVATYSASPASISPQLSMKNRLDSSVRSPVTFTRNLATVPVIAALLSLMLDLILLFRRQRRQSGSLSLAGPK